MADSISITLRGNLAADLDRLGEVVRTTVLRSGQNTAAFAFQEEAKLRAPVFAVGPRGGGASKVARGKIKPGQLRDSIYRVFDEKRSLYVVSWNHKKAPHAHLIEFGTKRAPAYPFLRPAYEGAKDRAMHAAVDRMRVKFAENLLEKKA
jgi:HK97 gp10 family phage protein